MRDRHQDEMKEPPTWWLGVGVSLILGAFVLLLLIPVNSWGF